MTVTSVVLFQHGQKKCSVVIGGIRSHAHLGGRTYHIIDVACSGLSWSNRPSLLLSSASLLPPPFLTHLLLSSYAAITLLYPLPFHLPLLVSLSRLFLLPFSLVVCPLLFPRQLTSFVSSHLLFSLFFLVSPFPFLFSSLVSSLFPLLHHVRFKEQCCRVKNSLSLSVRCQYGQKYEYT